MRGRGSISKRLAAALVVVVLGLAVALTLAQRGARSALREPFVPKATRGVATSVPLEARESRKRTTVHRMSLSFPDAGVLLEHDELQLLFSSNPPLRKLVRGELQVRSAACTLEARGGELASGEPVAFHRVGECAVARLHAADADLMLELREPGELALLGFEPIEGSPRGPIQAAALASGAVLDVRGAFVDYTLAQPRIFLLNAMWRGAAGAGWLWASLAAGVALACAGCFMFPTHAFVGSGFDKDLARAAVAVALVAGSLGVLYAVLVPPLMGPDEPYHLLGFAELSSDRALAADTVAWMGETHLWRIRYQPKERFRSIDVGQPYVVKDDQLRPTEVEMRSAVLARLWATAAPIAGRTAPQALLRFRLLNALVFALAMGAATALAIATAGAPFPQLLALPLLLVPSLPFFAMHVSETAVLCSIYVLLAAAVAVLFLDGPRADWVGLPLGLATGLMLAGGRSPWPLAGLVTAVLAGRVVLGSRASDQRRAAIVFWCGFAAGITTLFLIQNEAYRGMRLVWGEHFTAGIPVWLRGIVEWLFDRPVAAVSLCASVGLLEIALRVPRQRVAALMKAREPKLVRSAALVFAGLVVLSLLGSLLLSYPQLELAPRRAPTAPERIAAVLGTMATLFRLTEPNFLLATSFWVGFGWLDTSPGPFFQAVLIALLAALLLLLLRHIALRCEARRLAWLLVLAAGGAFALVLYTLTTQVAKPLHGRYLIGWYLCLLAVVGSSLALDHRPVSAAVSGPPSGTARAAFLLVVTGLIHAYCLGFILVRYF
jgi:hypothetical protein